MNAKQAKTNARRLKSFLKAQGITLPYATCLEAIAHTEGVANWQTLEARKPTISVSVDELTGQPTGNFFELPFMHPISEWPVIDQVLLAYEDEISELTSGIRYYRDIHAVDEDAFEILAKEARGETLSEEDEEYLDDAEDQVILDWGDEYETEGLTLSQLRGIVQVSDSEWKLPDGRLMELHASGKVIVPMASTKTKRKRK